MEKLLSGRQVAEILGFRESTLNVWRSTGKGPRFVKIGSSVRYKMSDLEDFINNK